MRLGQSPELTDPADVRFRLATIKSGCWLTLAVGFFVVFYSLRTWSAGHRTAILVLVALCVVFTIALLTVVPLRAIVVGRWRETFFMAWSFLVVVVVLVMGVLDARPSSPLTLPLFMPLIFAGMSYPIRPSIVVASLTLAGDVLVSAVQGVPLGQAGLMLACLAWTASMAIWQAHLRNGQRRELDQHRDDLARASRIDPLTGALNRRGFEERLQDELAGAADGARPLTLATLDLDDFKAVNDRHGHAAGDAALVLIVEAITAVLRPDDAIGRLGGDEFAVVLPRTGPADAAPVIARLRDALPGHMGASFGHSCFPSDGVSADELLRHADMELYAAKRTRSGGAVAAA